MRANAHTKRELGPDERRERRKLRREKQRANNIGRAQKMHVARLTAKLPDREKVDLPSLRLDYFQAEEDQMSAKVSQLSASSCFSVRRRSLASIVRLPCRYLP